MSLTSALRNDDGVALPITLLVLLILAAIVLGLAQTTTGEIEIARLTRWDTHAQYLAQAATEHLIYVLKRDKPVDLGLSPVNFPATAGEEFWYYAEAICQTGCAGSPPTRTWVITASGEIRQPGSGPPTVGSPCAAPCLQRRDLRVGVEITYAGAGNATPTAVTLLRWEEVYP